MEKYWRRRELRERHANFLRNSHGMVEAAGVELRDAVFVNVLTAHDF
jgi:hypothetical protein